MVERRQPGYTLWLKEALEHGLQHRFLPSLSLHTGGGSQDNAEKRGLQRIQVENHNYTILVNYESGASV